MSINGNFDNNNFKYNVKHGSELVTIYICKVADSYVEGDTYNLIVAEVIPALENQRGGS